MATSSLAFLPIKAGNILIMGVRCCTALELSRMHDRKSLTFRWHSLFGGSSDISAGIFAYEGGQYYHYGSMPLQSPWIIQNAWPETLRLRWRSFSRGSSDVVASIFASNGGQYYDYGSMPLYSPWPIQDARPKIIDTLFTFIYKRW